MKKIVSIILALCLCFSFGLSSFALEYGEEWAGYQSAEKSIYKDVDTTHWAYKAIVHSNSTGWFSGYPDGTFRPNNPITRAEAMKVFVQFLGLPKNVVTTTSFTDVKPNDWFAPFVEAGKTLYPDTHSNSSFRPNMPITREVAMYALVVALRYNSAENINFADVSILNMFNDAYSLSAATKAYVAVAVEKGLVAGRADGTIGGQDPLTRAEFATLLYRAQFIGFGDGPGPSGVTMPTQPVTNPTQPTQPTTAPTQPTVPPTEPTDPTVPTDPVVADGTLKGNVVDAADNSVISGATVVLTKDGVTVAETTTNNGGDYSFVVPGGEYVVTVTMTGYVPASITETVIPNAVEQATQVRLAKEIAENGVIFGKVVNALTGEIVAGATLKLTQTVDGSVVEVQSATSPETGEFNFEVPAGNYTLEATKEGFITATKTVVSQDAATAAEQDITISPVVDGVRVVLTWGENPRDLDSHLTGPTGEGDRYHVFYVDMEANTDDGAVLASLDVDDVTSYGPETITINSTVEGGIYRYSVHDYTNRYSTDSTAMSLSGAKVEVYSGESLIHTFNVPSNQVGTVWTVFEYSNHRITPINEMKSISNPGEVGLMSLRPTTSNDVQLIVDTMMEK